MLLLQEQHTLQVKHRLNCHNVFLCKLVIEISIWHFWISDISIAILFYPSFGSSIDVPVVQLNCNLTATAAVTSQAVDLALSRVWLAAQQRHWCQVAEGRTTTISEFKVSPTVRCTVTANIAVHSYRGESLQPYFWLSLSVASFPLWSPESKHLQNMDCMDWP